MTKILTKDGWVNIITEENVEHTELYKLLESIKKNLQEKNHVSAHNLVVALHSKTKSLKELAIKSDKVADE